MPEVPIQNLADLQGSNTLIGQFHHENGFFSSRLNHDSKTDIFAVPHNYQN